MVTISYRVTPYDLDDPYGVPIYHAVGDHCKIIDGLQDFLSCSIESRPRETWDNYGRKMDNYILSNISSIVTNNNENIRFDGFNCAFDSSQKKFFLAFFFTGISKQFGGGSTLFVTSGYKDGEDGEDRFSLLIEKQIIDIVCLSGFIEIRDHFSDKRRSYYFDNSCFPSVTITESY